MSDPHSDEPDPVPDPHRARVRRAATDEAELAHRRQTLIALNAAAGLSRDTMCRLAATLDRWLDTAVNSAGLAASLALPPSAVERARRLAGGAAEAARREESECRSLGGYLLTRLDPAYPSALLDLPQPPPVLYCRGHIPERPAVAVVGSRRADAYGLEAAAVLARELAGLGLVVVSGFARGIDITAHRSALAVDGGETIAVLGCGLGVSYPRQHAADRERIAGRGALVSELPCRYPPRRASFPIRNRLIAALSVATLVVQAAPRSGSLITARYALDLGREVCTIPGPLFESAWRGSNHLLRDGALLVESAADIVAALPLRVRSALPPPTRPAAAAAPASRGNGAPPALPGLAGELLAHLRPRRPRPVEELATLAGAPVGATLAALLRLELAGHARRHAGGAYSLTPCERAASGGSVPRCAGRRPE
jgi:DNA processing protein